jgi:predicted NACHT family NTPase
MELFLKEFVPELNTKNLGDSASFLTAKQTTPSAKRFRENGILMINVAAKFCPWTEQPQMNLQYSVLN